MRAPATLTAGDSATWLDYPFGDALDASVDAGSYTLTYSFRGPIAAAKVDLAGTAAGTAWQFVLTSAQTAAFNVSAATTKWFWAAYANKSGVRITAGQGVLLVKPNLAAIDNTTVYDGSSPNEQVLKAIDAEIAARINGGATLEYTIGTRSLKKEPMTALLELQTRYRMKVARERRAQSIANGLGNPSKLGVRFSS